LIDGESCPREVGQRTLSRTHGRERIWVGEGLIDGESCPREGEGQRELSGFCMAEMRLAVGTTKPGLTMSSA
jgi:hypothetical protein